MSQSLEDGGGDKQYPYRYKEVDVQENKSGLKKKKNFHWPEYAAASAVCFGMFLGGVHFGWMGPTLPFLIDKDGPIKVTSNEVPWVAGCLQIGAIPGSIIGSIISDCWGRKIGVLSMTIPYFIGSIILFLATNVNQLYMARLTVGLGVGACFSVIPMYIGEIASPEIRGILGVYKVLFLNCGTFLQFCLAPFVSIQTNAIVCTCFPIVMFLVVLFIPESPYYLLMKGEFMRAEKSLKCLRGRTDVTEELSRLIEGQNEANKEKSGYFDIVTIASNRKAIFIICALLTIQQNNGATAIFTYSQVIFGKADISISPETCGILLAGTNFFITFICGSLVDVLGRRPLCIFSCLFGALSVFLLGVYFHLQEIHSPYVQSLSLLPPIVIMMFKFAIGIGVGPVPYLVLAELFPTNVKATALGFASVYGSIAGVFGTKLYQVATDTFSEAFSFYGYTIFGIIGAFFVFVFLQETKGKTLEEIQNDLKGKQNKS